MIKKKSKRKLSLCNKIILIIVAVLIACTFLWTATMFFNMSENAKEVALSNEKTNMLNVSNQLKDVEETCYLMQQIMLQKESVLHYIQEVKKGNDLGTVEKIEFYKSEIGNVDYMININPYIYNVRFFVNANITERQPCFYKISRMKNLEWADAYENNRWIFDYSDSLYSNNPGNSHLAGLVTDITDDNGNLLAVLEVSTNLEDLFLNFYKKQGNEFSCFVTNDGKIYSSDVSQKIVKNNRDAILKLADSKKSDSVTMKFNHETSVVSTLDCPSLNGVYIHTSSTKEIVESYYRSQMLYFVVLFVSMICFIILIVILIKSSFSRFNHLTSEVSKIKSGEHIRLTEKGNDEISELGKQINDMLSTLEKLNIENTNKELLTKNAEIRSLQNQINAHFMYNVLETIKMMAEIKEDYEISDAVTSLGNMFRYSMQWTTGMVELKTEINHIRNYLDLMNLRQDYEIYLSLNIPEELMKIKIPKMSLQPIVENSVYHGIENVAEDTSIYIKAFVDNDTINIEVSDAGAGMSEEQLKRLQETIQTADSIEDEKEHGRALYNVQQRIKMYFGNAYGLSIYSKEGLFTKVLIQIPADKENGQ